MGDRDRGPTRGLPLPEDQSSGSSAGEVEVRPPVGPGSPAGEFEVDPRRSRGRLPTPTRIPERPSPFPTIPNPQISHEDRAMVRASVAMHFGDKMPGIDYTSAIDPIVDKAVALAGDNPAFLGAVKEDANALMALTDTEIAERLMRGQPLGQFTDLWDSIAEMSWEIGATELASRVNAEQTDAVKGTFDALTHDEARTMTIPDAAEVSNIDEATGDTAKAREFQTLFDVPGAWSFSPTSGVLAVTVGEQTVGVEARPGFDPQNHLDVMAEVVSAQAEGRIVGGELTGGQARGNVQAIVDKAHEVGVFIEERPWLRYPVDRIWEGLNRTVDALRVGDDGDPQGLEMERQRLAERREAITEESIRQASAVPLPIDAITATLARLIMDEREDIRRGDALEMAADMVEEDRDQFLAEFQNLTAEEIAEELQEQAEGQSPLGEVVEGTLDNSLQVIETWDNFSQTVGIHFIDLIKDIHAAGGVVLEADDWQEGWERLQPIFEAPQPTEDRGEFAGVELTTAADYFDLEGTAADAANLAVAVVFDPLNYLLPGSKGIRAMTKRALTNPKLAPLYLKTGSFPGIARSIAGVTRRSNRARQAARRVADDLDVPPDMTLGEAEAVFGRNSREAAAVAAREAEEETAEEASARAIRNVIASTSTMKSDHIWELTQIAKSPTSTVDDVNAVWQRALEDDWIPDTAGRPRRHSTVEGVGRALDSIAEDRLSPEARETMMQMVAKLSVHRTMRIGERQFLDEFGDLLVQFFPTDKDKLVDWWEEALLRFQAAGDSSALKGAAHLQKEQARRQAWEAGGAIRSIERGEDLRDTQQNLRQIENELAELSTRGFDDATTSAIREQLERMHSVMARRVEEASPRIAAHRANVTAAQKELKQATWLENDVANAARNQQGALVFELYDDIAKQINEEFGEEIIPVMADKTNPLAPGVDVRDWSKITGVSKDYITDEDELALLMGLAVDDADVARGLSAIGAFNRSQKVVLPASPYEVIAFRRLAKNETALGTWTKMLRSEFMKKAAGGMKLAFAANLLLNPLTAGKVTLDETLRFFADTGEFGTFLRATSAGLPGVGRLSEQAVEAFSAKYGSRMSNPYAGFRHQYKRNVGGWNADDFSDYGWVERPPKGITDPAQFRRADYRETAERWVNGTLLQDDRFREYARWIDEAEVLEDGTKVAPEGFVRWWNEGDEGSLPGRAQARETTVTIREQSIVGDELTANDAFNIIDNAFNQWADMVVDQNQRGPLKRALLQSARGARGPLDVTADAHLLNAIERVPGLQGKTGLKQGAFNVFFGGPSGRRAGVFYEHYFDEAMEILQTRHAGRIITVDDIIERAGVDEQTAQHYMKQGADNRIVSQLIADTGGKTEAQLAAKAAQWAERRADDLMYSFQASSLAGRGTEAALLFPFARAQVDFLSWWSDHMTKPLNLFGRMPLEARARLPEIVQNAMNTVDRIPINLRAWSRFAHMAAPINNEHESVIDQTIENLTFFPVRFDSEFLLDVSPQFGPLPSWMFDIAVDKGVIDEETEKNFMAVFPALDFTELEGNVFEDAFNRILPDSRRSLRDLMGSALRNGYALRGKDVFTEAGVPGQLANVVADGKRPWATGDFQAALVADLLRVEPGDEENVWNLVPGSDEWNRRVAELAVKGALQANTVENWRDLWDRISPVSQYDREYQALQAFDGLFDDRTFGDLQRAGVFTESDLVETDGQPYIVSVWEKYQAGEATAEEKEWLSDRLHTVYFNAGDVEILPGFSYLDWLNVSNPQITVNLINKSEDSSIPVRSKEHADFKQQYINRLTGRLQNVPPGDTGRELIAEARRNGWVTSRPVEEWATDAGNVAYSSARRAIRGVWEWVSHRTWQAGTKQSIEDKTFTLGEKPATILQAAGLEVEAGTEFTYGDFHQLLSDFDHQFRDVYSDSVVDVMEGGTVHRQLFREDDPFGRGLIEQLGELEDAWRDAGIDSVEDWSEESKASVRDAFKRAIDLGYTTPGDYAQEVERFFGPLDYEPPTPPPVADLDAGIRLAGDDLQDLQVIDGDTVSVIVNDGPMRVRLVGINAPEVTQDGYSEARSQLARVVAEADEVVLGIYQPETFGLTQWTRPEELRLMAWLYVDGVPIYDPSVFGADNPRGAGVGGNVVDLEAILEAGGP